MLSLIGFELKKILARKATSLSAIVVFMLLIAVLCMNVFQQQAPDAGRTITGTEAIATNRANISALAGTVTDERLTADLAEFRSFFKGPNELKDEYATSLGEAAEGVPRTLSEPSRYENDRFDYLQTFLQPWMNGWEFPSSVIWKVDTTSQIDYSEVLRQRVVDRLDNGMSGTWTYSEAERDFWLSHYDAIAQPLEYGWAGGWRTILDCFNFLLFVLVAICAGVAPVFAGEYRERTDAVILATRHGKSQLPLAKVLAALLYATGMLAVGLLIAFGIPLLAYGAEGADLPVQLMGVTIPFAQTLGQATLIMAGMALVGTLGLTAFMLFLSARWRSTLGIALVGFALLLLPLFVSVPAYGIALHIRILMPGMALGFGEMFKALVSYPLGPVVFDAQTMTVLLYLVLLALFAPLAMRVFKRHQVA